MEELEEPLTGWQQPPQRENRGHLPLIRSSSPQRTLGVGMGRLRLYLCSQVASSLTPTLLPSCHHSLSPCLLISGVSLTPTGPCMGTGTVDEDGQDSAPESGACGLLLSMPSQGTEEGAGGQRGVGKLAKAPE